MRHPSRLSDLVMSVSYTLLLWVPDFYTVEAPSRRGYVLTMGFLLLYYLCLSSTFCTLVRWGRQRLGGLGCLLSKGIHVVVHLLLYGYAISSLVIIRLFNLQWNEITFGLIRETNPDETSGFFATYATSPVTLTLLALFGLFGLVELAALKLTSAREEAPAAPSRAAGWVRLLLGLWPLYTALFFVCPDWIGYADRYFSRSGLWNVYRSWNQFNSNLALFDECASYQKDIAIDTVAYTSPNIVVIIGESYIRHHSQLYGYPLPTNPRLSQLEDLYLFDDVISPYNSTAESFRNFMTLASVDGEVPWQKAPMFPAVFRQAGYNVVFYSNQYVQTGYQSSFDASAGFMNLPSIAPHLWSHRNREKFAYDQQLLDLYEQERDALECPTHNLILYHLAGQHYPAGTKFPPEETLFTAADIDREGLTDMQRAEIADYDNATRYNDGVVARIVDMWRERDAILLYFADHGDEVHDFRDKVGRSYDFKEAGAQAVHCQLDIPFLICVTPQYKEHHPEMVEEIAAAQHRPFMADDLPHLLMYLAGIESPWFKPERALIHPAYNTARRRKIDCSSRYYEDYCTGADSIFHL